MWAYLFGHHHIGDSVTDYSLAGALASTPLWVPYLADLNIVLTTFTLAIGIFLGLTRLYRDCIAKKEKE